MTAIDPPVAALHAFACLLVADLLSGVGHWLEDAYGQEDWPLTGRLITQPNVLHHHDPRHFTRHSWLHSSWLLILLAAGGVLIAWASGLLDWHVWLVAALLANANQIHKWAHRTPRENGAVITWLQRTGLLQSATHHAGHHQQGKNTHYCILTNLLNPLLDAVGFWSGLERLIHATTGVRRRFDHSASSHGAARFASTPPCRHCQGERPGPWHTHRGAQGRPPLFRRSLR